MESNDNKVARSVTLRPVNVARGRLLGGGELKPDGTVKGGNLSAGVDLAFNCVDLAGEAIEVLRQVYLLLASNPEQARTIAQNFLEREQATSDSA